MISQLAIFGAQYLYVGVVLLAAVWWWRQPYKTRLAILVLISIMFPLIYIVRLVAGTLYYDPLPQESANFQIILDHKPGNGFPSDHTLLCSAIALVPTLYRSWFSVVLWGLTFFVGISRVYLGLHHPLDIAASALISVAVGWLAWTLLAPLVKKFQERWSRQEI